MPIGNEPDAAKRRAAKPALSQPESRTENATAQAADSNPDYEDGLMPLDFVLRTMRDKKEDIKDRKEAAKLALPYAHSRLSPIAPADNQETEKQKRYKEASNSLVRKIAEFRAKLRDQS